MLIPNCGIMKEATKELTSMIEDDGKLRSLIEPRSNRDIENAPHTHFSLLVAAIILIASYDVNWARGITLTLVFFNYLCSHNVSSPCGIFTGL